MLCSHAGRLFSLENCDTFFQLKTKISSVTNIPLTEIILFQAGKILSKHNYFPGSKKTTFVHHKLPGGFSDYLSVFFDSLLVGGEFFLLSTFTLALIFYSVHYAIRKAANEASSEIKNITFHVSWRLIFMIAMITLWASAVSTLYNLLTKKAELSKEKIDWMPLLLTASAPLMVFLLLMIVNYLASNGFKNINRMFILGKIGLIMGIAFAVSTILLFLFSRNFLYKTNSFRTFLNGPEKNSLITTLLFSLLYLLVQKTDFFSPPTTVFYQWLHIVFLFFISSPALSATHLQSLTNLIVSSSS